VHTKVHTKRQISMDDSRYPWTYKIQETAREMSASWHQWTMVDRRPNQIDTVEVRGSRPLAPTIGSLTAQWIPKTHLCDSDTSFQREASFDRRRSTAYSGCLKRSFFES